MQVDRRSDDEFAIFNPVTATQRLDHHPCSDRDIARFDVDRPEVHLGVVCGDDSPRATPCFRTMPRVLIKESERDGVFEGIDFIQIRECTVERTSLPTQDAWILDGWSGAVDELVEKRFCLCLETRVFVTTGCEQTTTRKRWLLAVALSYFEASVATCDASSSVNARKAAGYAKPISQSSVNVARRCSTARAR